MGDHLIGMLQFALLTFLAAVAAGVMITVCTYLYCLYIRQKGKDQYLRDRIAVYSRIVTGFQDRLDRRKSDAAGAASVLFASQRTEKQLRQRLRDLEKEPYQFIRVVGAEVHPNRPYEVLATNTSVAHQVKRGERHAFFDSSWARSVTVHVWAKSGDEARMDYERAFPRAAGFKLLHIQALQGTGAGTPKSESEAAAPSEAAESSAVPSDESAGAEVAALRNLMQSAEMPA